MKAGLSERVRRRGRPAAGRKGGGMQSDHNKEVFMRTTWHGTHQGRLMGIDATGRHVDFSSMDEIRIPAACPGLGWPRLGI